MGTAKGQPYTFTLDEECLARLQGNSSNHYFVLNVDGGSGVINAMVDGILCDGGATRVQGWAQMPVPTPLGAASAGEAEAKVGPVTSDIQELLIFGRYLRTAEMLGNYRAGMSQANAIVI